MRSETIGAMIMISVLASLGLTVFKPEWTLRRLGRRFFGYLYGCLREWRAAKRPQTLRHS